MELRCSLCSIFGSNENPENAAAAEVPLPAVAAVAVALVVVDDV